jgi:subfamily B ATP-binding cassette protein MsbA
VINPAKAFSTAYYKIQKGLAAVDRIDKILYTEDSIQEVSNAAKIESLKDQIKFEDVSFKYNEDGDLVLKNIDLEIRKGEVVALVGPSGSGKSTLVDLLPRFYDVLQGKILIDGKDLREYKIHDLRSLMGIVSQEAILFNDSIYNNIVFGLEGVSKSEVEEAAKVAHAHDFILETEQGYDTNIGDRGVKLSGGQRQRLTIARAILRNPPILILDEATSALDSESEKLVQSALGEVMKNRTAIVIAHRLSTIQHANRIVVIKDGEIIEQGSHDDLMNEKGEYNKFVALQAF